MVDVIAEFTLEPDITYTADIKVETGTKDHTLLYNREEPDQHPMGAITGLETALEGKQDILTAGDNIQIEDGIISATDTTYTAGQGISIEDGVISNTQTSAEWGNIEGNLSDQTDLAGELTTLALGVSANQQAISSHVSNKNNPHEVTKTQLGLGNVDNTSDLNKPISTATQTALDGKQDNLTTAQLNAVNSGIDSTKVAQIATNTNDISSLQSNKADKATTLAGYGITDAYTKTEVDTALSGKQNSLDTTQMAAVNSGANTTNIGQIATNTSDIADINALIPNQASSSNQLADIDFVNSSIATNTANFIGTFNSVAELEAYSGTLTNNDYAFVTGTDTAGNTYYDRYKWNGSQWLFEYELNNSSFTAAQWASINSGATSEKIDKISTNETAINNHIANKNNPHEVTKAQVGLGNVDNTSDLNKPISTATQTALNEKVDKVSSVNRVYGTDANGNQTTYDKSSFGQVDDVQVGGVSVVTNKIAVLGTMAGETASDYSTKAVADTLYADIAYENTIDTHIADTSNPHSVTKAQVGLGNVDNTADLDKPISTATQTALDNKQDKLTSENAGTDIEITDIVDVETEETVTGVNTITLESAKANSLTSVTLAGGCEQLPETYLDTVTASGGCEQNGTPTANQPIDIISNNGAIKVSPNLFNINDIYGNYLLTDGGQVGNEAQNFVLTNFIRVFPNTTYVFSFVSGADAQYRRVCGYFAADQDSFTQLLIKKARPTTVDVQFDLTFTTNAYTNYIRISTCVNDTNIQVVQGATAPTYRPYKQIYADGITETITDNVGNVATCQMLLKIFNSIDTQEILSGTVTRDIDITVLDGSEEYSKLSNRYVYSSSAICPNITRTKSVMYCTHFVYDSGSTSEIPDGTIGTANTSTNVFIRNDSCTSVAQYQQWLKDQYAAGTPVIIVYQRQTETTESVTGQVLQKSPVTQTAGSISGLPIVETSSSHTVPTPTQPLQINCNNGVLGIDSQGNITVTGTTETVEIFGDNLFTTTGATNKAYLSSSGAISSTPSSPRSVTDYIKVKPSTKYILKGINFVDTSSGYLRIGFQYTTSKSAITQIEYPLEHNTFTTNATCEYIRIQYVTDSTSSVVFAEEIGDTATAQNLLKVGTYQDVQEVISGGVTRNVGIKVFDGTEDWTQISGSSAPFALVVDDFMSMNTGTSILVYSTHFQGVPASATWSNYNSMISFTGSQGSEAKTFRVRYLANTKTLAEFKQFLAEQYTNGTPVICVYCKTATTETVTAQPLSVQAGTNTLAITQASIDTLGLTAEYTKIIQGEGLKISFANDSGYLVSSDITTGSTNGTISVNGSDVSVYGLGSAAYTASTAYDASGAASTAETNAKNYADSLASNYATAAQGTKADTALQPADLTGYATETWVGNQGYITQAVDDSSTSSTTLGWSASKLNTMLGDIESTINTIRGV